MDMYIDCRFDAVFTVNGVLCERGDKMTADETAVLYVTVFPLGCSLLPYTLRLNGLRNLYDPLARGYRHNDIYILKLRPRYMYAYAPKLPESPPADIASRFFAFVKDNDLHSAFALCTDSLKGALNADSLTAYFADYDDIAQLPNGKYLLCSPTKCDEFEFTLLNGKIDDVSVD